MVHHVRMVEELYKLKGKVEQENLDWEELALDCCEMDYESKEKDEDGLYIVDSKEDFEMLLQKYENVSFEHIANVGEHETYAEVGCRINEKTPLWIVCLVHILPRYLYETQ